MRRSQSSFAAVVVLLATMVLAFAPPAGAASRCGKQVVQDWVDNGRIDRLYDLHCYEEGLDSIPAEIRDYSNAEDVIRLAYLAAGGKRPLKEGTPSNRANDPPERVAAAGIDTSASSDVPIPVLILGALSLVLVGAGALGYVSRRRESTDEDGLA